MKELMKKNSETTMWGNKLGVMLLPVYYHINESNPLHYLKRAKIMMDRKKLSMEAFLSHQIGCFVMKFFGAKVTLNCVISHDSRELQLSSFTHLFYYLYDSIRPRGVNEPNPSSPNVFSVFNY